ncbi:hypothetical protein AOLI_G00246370 [Acnodon oligacanthus]
MARFSFLAWHIDVQAALKPSKLDVYLAERRPVCPDCPDEAAFEGQTNQSPGEDLLGKIPPLSKCLKRHEENPQHDHGLAITGSTCEAS